MKATSYFLLSGGWHTTTFARYAETASKLMACAALFSIILPTVFPNTFLTLFLVCSIIAGNYTFKLRLITDNSIALLVIAIFLLLAVSLLYTTAPMDDALGGLGKHGKLLYIPLLLSAFHEQHWQRRGLVAFLSGAAVMLLLSYATLSGWSWEGVYKGRHALVYNDATNFYQDHTVFRNTINHGIIMAYAAYLFVHHALDEDRKAMRILLILLAALASFNVLSMIASRTGQLLLVALILLLVYQRYPGWKRMLLALAVIPLLAVTVMTFSGHTQQRWWGGAVDVDVQGIQQGDYRGSLGKRLVWMKAGWDAFKRNSVWGAGVGSFNNEAAKYLQTEIAETPVQIPAQYRTHNPDNDYVSMGVQLGAIGLFFLLVLFAQQWRISSRLPPFSSYAAQGMILVVVLSSFAHSFMYSRTRALFFVLLTALCFSAYLSNQRTDDASNSS